MKETKRRFKNIPMFGYFEAYLYLEFEDETVTVCETSMDFSKPLTQKVFDKITNVFVDYYASQGKQVLAGKFVTKEVYEQLREKIGTGLEFSFDGDNVEVKQND